MQNKIVTSSNKLQPTIFKAILNLYKKGFLQITARMVKEECVKIDLNIEWNNRLKAICNSMGRIIECGFTIISENRPHNDFTISFDGNATNLHILSPKNTTPKDSNQNLSIDKEIDKLLEQLDWEKLKDKNNPKLLIIGCSDSKTQGGINQIGINYFNSVQYNNLLNDRNANKIQYNRLFLSDPNYFIFKNNDVTKPIKRNGYPVVGAYFSGCIIGNLFKPALDRYEGGDFYKPQL